MDLQELESLARQELDKHGLKDWKFAWASTKRRLGVCKHAKKQIEIAKFYAANNTREHVIDTLWHEIAHALAGPRAGHGLEWKAIAVRLGASPLACDSSPQTVMMPGDWQAHCPACGKTYHRYQRPLRLTGYRCRCPARSPLTYQFAGDPSRAEEAHAPRARWEARCAGCRTVHVRLRKPRAGKWLCRCPVRSELTWEYRAS